MQALVIFKDENYHWAGDWLRPGYRHVLCVVPAYDGEDGCVAFDVTIKGLQTVPLPGRPTDYIQDYENRGAEVLVVDYTPEKRPLFPMLLNNCVGLTKHMIGIRSWAVTPWQLHRHLTRGEQASWRESLT